MRAGLVAALLVGAAAEPLGPDTLVGRVGDREVRLAEIDRRSHGAVTRLLARRHQLLAAALEARIDALLLARHHGSEAAAVAAWSRELATPAATQAFRETHAGALPRDPELAGAVARHLIAATGLPERRRAALASLRGATPIERRLPGAPGPLPEVVARVGEVAIRAAEIQRAARYPLYRQRGRIVAEARRGFREIADEILAAAAPDAPPEVAPVGEAEVAAYIAERPGLDLTPERVRPYLTFRREAEARLAWLAGLRAATPPRFLLEDPEPPRFDPVALGLGETRAGEAPARQTLIVWSNFRCQPCDPQREILSALARGERPPRIRWHPFFAGSGLSLHADALAGVCADRQGALGALHAAVLATRDGPDAPLAALVRGRAIVPDGKGFDRCLASAAAQERVAASLRAAARVGFRRVPSFLVDGWPVEGFQGRERLEALLTGGPAGARTDSGRGG